MKLANKLFLASLSFVVVTSIVSIPTSMHFINQQKAEIIKKSQVYFDETLFKNNIFSLNDSDYVKEIFAKDTMNEKIETFANLKSNSIQTISIYEGEVSDNNNYSLSFSITLNEPYKFSNNNNSALILENIEIQIPKEKEEVPEQNNPYFNIDENGVLVSLSELGKQQKILRIPENVNSIIGGNGVGENIFCDANNLEEVILPSTITNLPQYCFAGSSIKVINIPSNIKTMEKSVFESCKNLSIATFSSNCSLNSIGESAFKNTSLISVTLPSSILKISNSAFENITSLRSILLLGQNINFEGDYVFFGCINTKIIICDHFTLVNIENQILSGNQKIPENQKIYIGV